MTDHIKYPRTFHLPWSDGIGSDDKVLHDASHFEGQEIVVTEKMDGECTTLAADYLHARSTTYAPHPSRDWICKFHAGIRQDIPSGWRVCGENLYAVHSIRYTELLSYFLGFSLWNQHLCLGWDETLDYFDLLGVTPVPTICRGIYDEPFLRSLIRQLDLTKQEGYVIRLVSQFDLRDFERSVAKYVRPAHVQSDQHWIHQMIQVNRLKP